MVFCYDCLSSPVWRQSLTGAARPIHSSEWTLHVIVHQNVCNINPFPQYDSEFLFRMRSDNIAQCYCHGAITAFLHCGIIHVTSVSAVILISQSDSADRAKGVMSAFPTSHGIHNPPRSLEVQLPGLQIHPQNHFIIADRHCKTSYSTSKQHRTMARLPARVLIWCSWLLKVFHWLIR